MAGNRTRINCLEGNYAHHYTTIAVTEVVSHRGILVTPCWKTILNSFVS